MIEKLSMLYDISPSPPVLHMRDAVNSKFDSSQFSRRQTF